MKPKPNNPKAIKKSPDLRVKLAGLTLQNPVLLASGTSGTGQELADFLNLNDIGAFITKTITLKPRPGNPPPRLAETPAGLLNAIGWQNPGLEKFIKEELSYLRKFSCPIIASVGGEDFGEYLTVAEALDQKVDALEINISCPNVEKGGISIGTDPEAVFELTRRLKKVCRRPVIVKLSPNVTDIKILARSAVRGGAEAVSLINTLKGLALDPLTGQPKLAKIFGGLSGPAIKPVALAMVWQVAGTVDVPVIGMGGIASIQDALEFFWAGAAAICVGTATFIQPQAAKEILEGLKSFLKRQGWPDLTGFRKFSPLSKQAD